MSYPINYPTPQNADVQIFSRGGSTSTWVKPQGCSFVYFTVIGAGGNGAGGTTSAGGGGGASGGLANFLCPAFLIPDVLIVYVGRGGVGNINSNRTRVEYQLKAGTAYLLLFGASGANASGSTGGSNPSGMGQNYFTAMGFLAFNGGQQGANAGANITQSTFLVTAGAGGATSTTGNGGQVTPLYGYPVIAGGAGTTGGNGNDGISLMSNILLGCGGSGGGGSTTSTGGNGGNSGFGSGGGGGGICTTGTSSGGRGGDGLAVIISW
jgi:hypothetical protein